MSGIYGFDNLPVSPQVRNLLATRGRRLYQPMTAARIRELARVEPGGGAASGSACEAVERMAEFEQQFSGLWYSIPRDRENGMEYGLDGGCAVFRTGFGPAFTGITDGAWTWPVDILYDGRTLMRLGGHVPDKATGPASRWWSDGDRAVLLRLERWWDRGSGAGMAMAAPDYWTMWCFARTESGLAWASARRGDIPGDPVPGQDWCVMCLCRTPENVTCRPTAANA